MVYNTQNCWGFGRWIKSKTPAIPPCSLLKVNWRFRGTYHLILLATRIHVGILLGLFFDPEDGGNMFLQNIGQLSTDYKALYPRWQSSTKRFVFIVSDVCHLGLKNDDKVYWPNKQFICHQKSLKKKMLYLWLLQMNFSFGKGRDFKRFWTCNLNTTLSLQNIILNILCWICIMVVYGKWEVRAHQ
jgi:hypothetical protein